MKDAAAIVTLPLVKCCRNSGIQAFTLIELSIVIVVIALIIAGILVGQSVINNSVIRSQITQLDRYNTAVVTFSDKYGGLPGDLRAGLVSKFGFTVVPTRAGTQGQGDGDGLIQGYGFNGGGADGVCCTSGETAWFWEDLSSNSGLIDQTFNYAGTSALPAMYVKSNPSFNVLMPVAKIGQGNYISVYNYNNLNYFNIIQLVMIDQNGALDGGDGFANVQGITNGQGPAMTPQQAYAIDKKVDDGLPQSGNVTAQYQNWSLSTTCGGSAPVWAAGGGGCGTANTSATPQSTTTCYDNGNVAGAVQHYSLGSTANGGVLQNCALSFQFQTQ